VQVEGHHAPAMVAAALRVAAAASRFLVWGCGASSARSLPFIATALTRRAGWDVRLAVKLGSFEIESALMASAVPQQSASEVCMCPPCNRA
jgi:membrane glycosyltransferase